MNEPTDEQIRDYLTRNPAALRNFIERDMRARPDWWRAHFAKEARIAGSWNPIGDRP